MARARITPAERLAELHTVLRLAEHVGFQDRILTRIRKCIILYFDACAFPNVYTLSTLEREIYLFSLRVRTSLPSRTMRYVVSKLALLSEPANDK
jgi:hypothetical protein